MFWDSLREGADILTLTIIRNRRGQGDSLSSKYHQDSQRPYYKARRRWRRYCLSIARRQAVQSQRRGNFAFYARSVLHYL